jgi:hypothetical protein
MISFVYYLDVFLCLYFFENLESLYMIIAEPHVIYIYIYMILSSYKMSVSTLSATKRYKKRSRLL